jgi:meiotically up-regulated gene 157 (Mug157) protein
VVRSAAARAVETLTVELDHEKSSGYRFVRPDTIEQDTLARDGLGSPVSVTGMTWSGFRPSDDACVYGYLVPSNLMAAHTLDLVGPRVADDLGTQARDLAASLRSGVAAYGTVAHPEHGEIWAYEVDGLGSVLMADDANMPSLLSLPLVAGIDVEDPRYLRTREFVLSRDNPYFYRGRLAAGPGSPHTPVDFVWPIALAVQGLSSRDPAESLQLLQTIATTTAGREYVHESFHVDDDSRFTRDWFSWADSMFCELALVVSCA